MRSYIAALLSVAKAVEMHNSPYNYGASYYDGFNKKYGYGYDAYGYPSNTNYFYDPNHHIQRNHSGYDYSNILTAYVNDPPEYVEYVEYVEPEYYYDDPNSATSSDDSGNSTHSNSGSSIDEIQYGKHGYGYDGHYYEQPCWPDQHDCDYHGKYNGHGRNHHGAPRFDSSDSYNSDYYIESSISNAQSDYTYDSVTSYREEEIVIEEIVFEEDLGRPDFFTEYEFISSLSSTDSDSYSNDFFESSYESGDYSAGDQQHPSQGSDTNSRKSYSTHYTESFDDRYTRPVEPLRRRYPYYNNYTYGNYGYRY